MPLSASVLSHLSLHFWFSERDDLVELFYFLISTRQICTSLVRALIFLQPKNICVLVEEEVFL
jgi:hypothetical protein